MSSFDFRKRNSWKFILGKKYTDIIKNIGYNTINGFVKKNKFEAVETADRYILWERKIGKHCYQIKTIDESFCDYFDFIHYTIAALAEIKKTSVREELEKLEKYRRSIITEEITEEIKDEIFEAAQDCNLEKLKSFVEKFGRRVLYLRNWGKGMPYHDDGDTPVHVAAMEGCNSLVEFAVKECGFDLKTKNNIGETIE